MNGSTQLWDGVMEWRILLVALPSDEMFVDGRVSRTLSKCSSSFERSGNDEASGKSPMLMFRILKVIVRLCFNFGKQPHVFNYRPSQVISKPPQDESHQTSNLHIRKMIFCRVMAHDFNPRKSYFDILSQKCFSRWTIVLIHGGLPKPCNSG